MTTDPKQPEAQEAPASEPNLAFQPKPAANVVPGKVHCAKCGFTLVRTNLYVNSGTTGPGDERVEPCPNDGNPMLPITWETEAREAWARCEHFFDRMVVAEKALAALGKQPTQEAPADAKDAAAKMLSDVANALVDAAELKMLRSEVADLRAALQSHQEGK